MHHRDSFYYRAIRTKVGDALRAQYDLNEPLPKRLTKTLLELDQREEVVTDDIEVVRHKA
jgi:hypothetical protein